MWLRIVFLVCMCSFFGHNAWSQLPLSVDSADFVRASIMIASPDYSRLQSSFGHMFLRMECPTYGVDYCFSFESEDSPGMFSIFTGNYNVSLLRAATCDYVSTYDSARTITAYPLNLRLEEEQRLWQRLDEIASLPIYPKHDYFHHGCSQEIMNILYSIIDGTVIFDEAKLPKEKTIHQLGCACSPSDCPTLLMATLGSIESTDYVLSPKQRLLEPVLVPTFLQAASIRDRQGNIRPLLLPYGPNDEWTTQPTPYQSGFPIWGMLSIVIALLVLIAVGEYVHLVPQWLSLATDGIVATAYVLITLLLLVVCSFSSLPTTSGWSWHLLVYNLLPIIAVALCMTKRFRPYLPSLMLIFTAVWVLYMLVMAVIGGKMNCVQYLLLIIFALRALTYSIINNKTINFNKV